MLYIRNEQSGTFWSPLPRAGQGDYLCRHGFGFSEFEHEQERIASKVTVFVCLDAPIKYTILRLQNIGDETQELSVSSYVEAKDTREVVDIAELNAELKTTVAKIDQLRAEIDAIVAEIEGEELEA